MNKLPLYTLYCLLGLILISSYGCKRGVSLSETDFKDMYSSSSEVPQPWFKIFHSSESQTEVHYMFDNQILSYNKLGEAHVKISWQLYADYSTTHIIDSASFTKIDTSHLSQPSQLQGVFKVPVPMGLNYIIKLITTDLNNQQTTITFVNINKTDIKNRQFFKVILKENNSVLFRNYFYKNEKLAIIYKQKNRGELFGKNYKTLFPVSPPPFSLSSSKPFDFNDFYEIKLDLINDTAHFEADEPGIYHFGIDAQSKYSGLTLFQYSPEFPEINTAKEMLDPLRFITSKREYGKLKKYQDTKKAVDEFWLSTSPDTEKARKLVKGYYNRVERANYFYTSFKEGWKTDRGIIFIVFGPPSIVYRSLTGESWTYGEQSNFKSLTFNFSKVNNPFTNNDYVLQRSTVFKNPWYRAIDAWRQGKVASLEY